MQIPEWCEGILGPKTFKEEQQNLKEYNELMSKKADELKKASENYNQVLNEIDEKYSSDKIVTKRSNIQKVLTISSQDLPFVLQAEIENFTPGEDNVETKKIFAKELTLLYMRALMEVVVKNLDNKDFDISDIIYDNVGLDLV
jgi:hypothetical protein